MMRRAASLLRAVGGIVALLALAWGTTAALHRPECTPGLPPHTCTSHEFCDQLCAENDYPFGGSCLMSQQCCLCVE
jgi:hypothetical protein